MAELLRAGRRQVRDVWVAEGLDRAPVLDEIVTRARQAGVPVRRVPGARLAAEARTEAPQGVLAHADALPEADLDELCRPGPGGAPPFLLALDGVTDPGNVGSLVRSAAAAGATGIVVPAHRGARVTPSVTKAAAGAVEHVALCVVSGLPSALARARDRGLWVVGLAPDGDTLLPQLRVASEPIVLVVGAEGPGLGTLVRRRCDLVVRIPQRDTVASLNVAVAGALALFEVARRRKS